MSALTGGIPRGQPPQFGQTAGFDLPLRMQSGVMNVGHRTSGDPNASLSAGGGSVIAKGFRMSEIKVVQAYTSKVWPIREFHKDQNAGQLMFAVHNSGSGDKELSLATLPQLNALLRGVHEKTKSMGRISRFADLTDADQIDELIYQMREGLNDFFLLGLRTGRITPETRDQLLNYYTVDGISDLWHYVGVHANSDTERNGVRSPETLNVASQGPEFVANVFQPIETNPDTGDLVLGPQLRNDDHCSVVLTRRYAHATQSFEEFCYMPVGSQSRYVDAEEREFVGYDGFVDHGPQTYVGRISDIVGGRTDPYLVARMRGISTTWRDAHAAHRDNTNRVKLTLGFEPANAACA